VLSGVDPGPVSASLAGDDDLTVRLTFPHEDLDLFDLDEALPWEPETVRKKPGASRNDPCPCGSGKKYKKCHLRAGKVLGKS